jgi:hypothetical protein
MMKKIVLLMLLCVGMSCSKNDSSSTVSVCDPATSYKSTVKAIFVASCSSAGCHDGNNLPSLADYQTAHDAAAQIKTAVANGVMPKNATLSASDKAALICWLSNGAQNN